MRIWSLHPGYLDTKGLVACWRETLLAQKVLDGKTAGYQNHPQLLRFRTLEDPLTAIGTYLDGIEAEAASRGYRFNRSLILRPPARPERGLLPVHTGQLDYETAHLLAKLAIRDPVRHTVLADATGKVHPHPLFTVVPGGVEDWEVR